jgi:hypothetical protein
MHGTGRPSPSEARPQKTACTGTRPTVPPTNDSSQPVETLTTKRTNSVNGNKQQGSDKTNEVPAQANSTAEEPEHVKKQKTPSQKRRDKQRRKIYRAIKQKDRQLLKAKQNTADTPVTSNGAENPAPTSSQTKSAKSNSTQTQNHVTVQAVPSTQMNGNLPPDQQPKDDNLNQIQQLMGNQIQQLVNALSQNTRENTLPSSPNDNVLGIPTCDIDNCISVIKDSVHSIADIDNYATNPTKTRDTISRAQSAAANAESVLFTSSLPEELSSLINANIKMLLGAAESRSAGESPRVEAQAQFLTNMCSEEEPPVREVCSRSVRTNLIRIAHIEDLRKDTQIPECVMIDACREAEDEYQRLIQYCQEHCVIRGDIICDIVGMLLDTNIAQAKHEPVPTDMQVNVLCGFLGIVDSHPIPY